MHEVFRDGIAKELQNAVTRWAGGGFWELADDICVLTSVLQHPCLTCYPDKIAVFSSGSKVHAAHAPHLTRAACSLLLHVVTSELDPKDQTTLSRRTNSSINISGLIQSLCSRRIARIDRSWSRGSVGLAASFGWQLLHLARESRQNRDSQP